MNFNGIQQKLFIDQMNSIRDLETRSLILISVFQLQD